MRTFWLVAVVGLLGCSSESPSGGEDGGTLDTSQAGLAAFVKGGSYRSWTGDPAVRGPLGLSPHGQVRTFFSPELEASLRDGGVPHPEGSVAVKEVYSGGSSTPTAAAVMVKTSEGTAANSWTYFEGDAPDFDSGVHGEGISSCAGCHASGEDYINSPLP